MSFTIDFLLLIILIVIPGLLFQRFYFQGEFSKQFTTKDSVYKSVFYSIIPGILIQLISYLLYIWIRQPEFSNSDLICIFKELLSKNDSYSDITNNFIEKGIVTFIIHEFIVFVIAICLGYLSYLVIRTTKLDISLKILRFKNQWYYVFSGEFKSFKKFKKAKIFFNEKKAIDSILKPTSKNQFQYYPVRADILLKENSEANLYTGYIIDYDLNYDNINDLDKLYLFRTYRYRDTKDSDKENNRIKIVGSKAKVPISGDVFLIDAKNILNLNLTFIPHSVLTKKGEVFFRELKKWALMSWGIISIFIIFYSLFINTSLFSNTFPNLKNTLIDYGYDWFDRLILALMLIQIISFALPARVRDDNDKTLGYSYSWKTFITRIIFSIVLGILLHIKAHLINF